MTVTGATTLRSTDTASRACKGFGGPSPPRLRLHLRLPEPRLPESGTRSPCPLLLSGEQTPEAVKSNNKTEAVAMAHSAVLRLHRTHALTPGPSSLGPVPQPVPAPPARCQSSGPSSCPPRPLPESHVSPTCTHRRRVCQEELRALTPRPSREAASSSLAHGNPAGGKRVPSCPTPSPAVSNLRFV